jgi:4'-phosphopantetheinyl transferase
VDIRAILFRTVIEGVHIWRLALDGFSRDQPRHRRAAAHSGLRRVLSDYLGEPPSAIEIEVGENGKPRLPDGKLQFNLSHSGDLALIAVSGDRPVGVDVERVKTGRDFLALAERALDEEDAVAVRDAAVGDRSAVFYAAWVRHEARLKCLGAGLTGPVPDSPVAVQEVAVGSGYAAAVAIAGEEAPALRLRALPPG